VGPRQRKVGTSSLSDHIHPMKEATEAAMQDVDDRSEPGSDMMCVSGYLLADVVEASLFD